MKRSTLDRITRFLMGYWEDYDLRRRGSETTQHTLHADASCHDPGGAYSMDDEPKETW